MKSNIYHESVMVKEVIDNLHIKKLDKIIDATVGTAGHTKAMLEKEAEVLGIEMDSRMLSIAQERVKEAKLVKGNFVDIKEIAQKHGFTNVSGILFDLGVSNLHLKDDQRGFSFSNEDQELDMRLDPKNQGVKAVDLLNALDKTQLTRLFAVVMDYASSKKLADLIHKNRPLKTVGDLKKVVSQIKTKKNLDPATLPMLALRIAVNSELDNLRKVLPDAYGLLRPGGRLLIITFHSAEAEIVKKKFKNAQLVLPSSYEIESNPRARSAKLWVITKK